mmetsp:Transcript_46550/g.101132  ORF Transcript_46550/g.101132 Transcript_46550/m.101132 type:complete len:227 (+) Transcript_46550:609-1289(+)
MELDVEGAKVELAEHGQTRLVSLLLAELVEELARQGLARLVVLGEAGVVHGALIVAPVLHKLRWQLDGVPLDAGDAGGGRVRHRRQHVLQTVAGLVEQSRHLTKGHQRRLAADRRRAVAREVRDGLPVEHGRLSDADVHPRAAALILRARVRIKVERGHVLLGIAIEHFEELHVRVPRRDAVARLDDVDVEQTLAEAEKTVEHVWQRKVGPQLLLLKAELRLRLAL